MLLVMAIVVMVWYAYSTSSLNLARKSKAAGVIIIAIYDISILCQIFNFCQHIALLYDYLYVASVFDFNTATVIVELLALLYLYININYARGKILKQLVA